MVDNTRIEESLSAFMDSEVHELEVRRVIKEIAGDSELRDKWHRFQLISSAMKRDLPHKMTDISRAISETIDREPMYKPGFMSLLQPLGKVAVAASVALVAVLGVQQLQHNSQNSIQAEGTQQMAESGNDGSGAAQFQLPAGFDLPPVAARTVSAGTQYENQYRPALVVSRRQLPELKNEAAIREYLNLMMERHTQNAANSSSSQGVLPLARLPQVDEGN